MLIPKSKVKAMNELAWVVNIRRNAQIETLRNYETFFVICMHPEYTSTIFLNVLNFAEVIREPFLAITEMLIRAQSTHDMKSNMCNKNCEACSVYFFKHNQHRMRSPL